MKDLWKTWYYSLMLLIIYIFSFHLWGIFQDRTFFLVSGAVTVILSTALLLIAHKRQYFINRVDLGCHILVIVDLALEAMLFEIAMLILPISSDDIFLFHNNLSFYYCAIAFAAVIGIYRYKKLKKS